MAFVLGKSAWAPLFEGDTSRGILNIPNRPWEALTETSLLLQTAGLATVTSWAPVKPILPVTGATVGAAGLVSAGAAVAVTGLQAATVFKGLDFLKENAWLVLALLGGFILYRSVK